MQDDATWRPVGGATPGSRGKVLLHGHCHQKALVGTGPDHTLLSRLGFEVEVPDTGCCGLAGSFGYEARHYDLAQKIGERVLLPEVRGAEPSTIIVTDGFSCRSQIAQGTGREALHLAEVVRWAGGGKLGVAGPAEVGELPRGEVGEVGEGIIAYPEHLVARPRARLGAASVAVAVASGLALAGGLAWWARARRRSGR
jgi:hypothetical protein